jgi:hypothetical protein
MRTPSLQFIAALLACALSPASDAADSAQIDAVKAAVTSRFANADQNHDGQLTRAEARGKMPHVYDHFADIDAMHKGSVTLEQIIAYGSAQYAAQQK